MLKLLVIWAKALAFILFYMLIRWTVPRFRFDQLMALAWKIFIPLALFNLLAVIAVMELDPSKLLHLPFSSKWWLLPISLLLLLGAAAGSLLIAPGPKRRMDLVQ